MESVSGDKFSIQEQKPIFTLAGETDATTTTDSYGFADTPNVGSMNPLISGLRGNELLNALTRQEARVGDYAPSESDMRDSIGDVRDSNAYTDDGSFYFTGYTRSESSPSGIWSNNVSMQSSRNDESMDSLDFLIKSLSSANNYISSLTREQVSLLRMIRPSLLYELLQEVAKARSDRRTRRALPNECAFCKNNGENEECYSTHSLKDWRGRVLCPILRDFRCPRCGATGDHAHTIKYCPEGANTGSVGLAARRRVPPSSLLLGANSANRQVPTPSASPGTSSANIGLPYSSIWSNFGIN